MPPAPLRPGRGRARLAGFTLIEVMLAISIGGMAVASAAAMLFAMQSRSGVIEEQALEVGRDANAERLIRTVLANLDLEVGSGALTGTGDSMELKTWCRRPAGWMARCLATLSFEWASGGAIVDLSFSDRGQFLGLTEARPKARDEPDPLPEGSHSIRLWRGVPSGKFIYLEHADDGGLWSETWQQLQPPPGVGIVLGNDTLFVKAWGVA